MKVTVSHSGKQHSYHLANALFRLGNLDKFYTSSYITSLALQQYLLNKGNQYWTRRFYPGLGGQYVDANWRFELKEVLMRKWLGKSAAVQEAVYNRDVQFDRYVAGKIKSRTSDIFWGFQGSCHQSLQMAKKSGKITLCELATAHVTGAKKILGQEIMLQPEWADSMDNLVFPSAYEKRLTEEPHLADFAVAASAFTRQTLTDDGIADNKIIYLPLGFDVSYIPYSPKTVSSQRPFRFLYAGTVTQRKGISYLLQAMELLKPGRSAELHIIGGIQGSGKEFKAKKHLYVYHPPVSQLELFKLYAQYDALVLPTIFEGFGLVLVEAMAAGLPIITTPHSIGPELVEQGQNGYIVPVRDVQALANAMQLLLDTDAAKYEQMSAAARATAIGYSWHNYRDRLQTVLHILNPTKNK
jgi:glycosyltransferase involved in cell wall biosynthesis